MKIIKKCHCFSFLLNRVTMLFPVVSVVFVYGLTETAAMQKATGLLVIAGGRCNLCDNQCDPHSQSDTRNM